MPHKPRHSSVHTHKPLENPAMALSGLSVGEELTRFWGLESILLFEKWINTSLIHSSFGFWETSGITEVQPSVHSHLFSEKIESVCCLSSIPGFSVAGHNLNLKLTALICSSQVLSDCPVITGDSPSTPSLHCLCKWTSHRRLSHNFLPPQQNRIIITALTTSQGENKWGEV